MRDFTTSTSVDIHFQALCNAVENEKVEKIRSILEHNPHLDVTHRNSDKLTPLDIAFMLGNQEIADILVKHKTLMLLEGVVPPPPPAQTTHSGDQHSVGGGGSSPPMQRVARVSEDVFVSPDSVMTHLTQLINESKKQVEKFGQLVKTADPKGVISVTSATGPTLPSNLNQNQIRECEKQKTLWTKRLNSLRRMRAGFLANFSPQTPEGVHAEVVNVNTLKVIVSQGGGSSGTPLTNPKALVTKFKIQWSFSENFSDLKGERIFNCECGTISSTNGGASSDSRYYEATIPGFLSGQTYYIRAALGNLKGYGSFCSADSNPVVPSTWRALDQSLPRLQNQSEITARILEKVLSEGGGGTVTPVDGHTNSFGGGVGSESVKIKRRGLFSQLLSAATSGPAKFQRTAAPNKLYLGCVLYHEDKVLMTNEDALPLILVDDLTGVDQATVYSEFHWFCKLSHMWSDVDKLKSKISGAEKKFGLKTKLVGAAAAMQGALGGLAGDLGTAFRVPIVLTAQEDSTHQPGSGEPGERCVIFSLVRHVKIPKSVVSLSLKWVPMSKAMAQHSGRAGGKSSKHHHLDAPLPSPTSGMDQLCYSIREQIIFQQVSVMTLPKGLYACYVQSFTTVDSGHGLNVVVSNSSPSVLPYAKVRDNPHVTSEEWAWVRSQKHILRSSMPSRVQVPSSHSPTVNYLDGEGEIGSEVPSSSSKHLNPIQHPPSTSQFNFGRDLDRGVDQLFDYLEVKEHSRGSHRIYDREVVELSPEVSLILVLPPPQSICFVQSSTDGGVGDTSTASIDVGRNDLLSLPLHTFEFMHLNAYHRPLLDNFCRSLTLIEVMLSSTKQALRETLDNTVMETAQSRISDLTKNQSMLEECWRPLRWLHDAVTAGRDPSGSAGGVSLSQLKKWTANNGGGSSTLTPSTPLPEQRLSSQSHKKSVLQDSKSGGGQQPSSLHHHHQQTILTNKSLPSSLSSSPAPLSIPEDNSLAQSHRQKSTSSIHSSENNHQSSSSSSVLQIFAAYECGLSNGTSVVINLTSATTAREVVDLVVKQLNMAVIMKGKPGPVYDAEQLRNFCLVAVIGNRERCLRDDFKPLNLQNPWKRGRLFVRVKNDVLAALECGTTSNENALPLSQAASAGAAPPSSSSTTQEITTTIL